MRVPGARVSERARPGENLRSGCVAHRRMREAAGWRGRGLHREASQQSRWDTALAACAGGGTGGTCWRLKVRRPDSVSSQNQLRIHHHSARVRRQRAATREGRRRKEKEGEGRRRKEKEGEGRRSTGRRLPSAGPLLSSVRTRQQQANRRLTVRPTLVPGNRS